MELRIGTSGYSYRHWRGAFYPAGLSPGEWLRYYAGVFDTVEINATFYRLPDAERLLSWREKTPDDFLFVVKASRLITHVHRLKDCAEALHTFLERVSLLAPKLGPVLYQLPPSLHRDDGLLRAFLDLLPETFTHVFEFRHESWYADAVRAMLAKKGAGFCIHDHGGRETPLWVTGPLLYARFHGTRRGVCYDETDLQEKAARLYAAARECGVAQLYAYFNNDAAACAPRDAQILRAALQAMNAPAGKNNSPEP